MYTFRTGRISSNPGGMECNGPRRPFPGMIVRRTGAHRHTSGPRISRIEPHQNPSREGSTPDEDQDNEGSRIIEVEGSNPVNPPLTRRNGPRWKV
jgi:hypothetical protein